MHQVFLTLQQSKISMEHILGGWSLNSPIDYTIYWGEMCQEWRQVFIHPCLW